MILDESPAGLASLYADIGRQLAAYESQADVLSAVTAIAVRTVPGAQWSSITRGIDGTFRTLAATSPEAETVDAIQYELRSGPCVDAVLQDGVFHTDDLGGDGRWPEFARRATQETGVRSMLSLRLFVEDEEFIAGLNLYSTRPAAFDRFAEVVGTLLATHGALAVSAATARERAAHLQRALATNRDIGVAMGVLMASHKITRQQAFDLLRVASQNTNRKLADVAVEVGDTGALRLPRTAEARPPAAARRPPGAPPATRLRPTPDPED